ncbi:DUF308 domain-containing protein [Candidatus Saccharibacteria bacterium]|nr:DUF308 domain-containing protein [Candidatus Saccharibacteria bacterium]
MAKKETMEVFEFDETSKNAWWTLVIGGLISVVFGFVAMIWPGITVGVLALLLAVFLGVYGVLDIVRSLKKFKDSFLSGFLTLVLGLLEVGVSVFLLSNVGSGLAIATLALLVAISFIVRGVIGMVLAFDSASSTGTRWLNGGVGALAIIAGLVIVWYPVSGTLAWIWVVGLFAIIGGAFEIALGFMAKEALEKANK